MVALQTRTGKQSCFAVEGFIKSSGARVARVTGAGSDLHFVTIVPGFSQSCKDAHGELCDELLCDGTCEHISAVYGARLLTVAQIEQQAARLATRREQTSLGHNRPFSLNID